MENGGLISVMNQAQISILNASLADLNLKTGISNSILHGNAQGKKRYIVSWSKHVSFIMYVT